MLISQSKDHFVKWEKRLYLSAVEIRLNHLFNHNDIRCYVCRGSGAAIGQMYNSPNSY